MSVNHIVTPLDSAVLDSKEQYNFYHKLIDFSLKEIIVGVQKNNLINSQELVFFKQYCDLLLYSIEAMRIKYMYDTEDNMKIDLTDSGFPNYLEFRYLFNDLSLRNQFIEKLKGIDELKTEFLDTLMRRKKPINRDKLFQAASIVYYTSVEQKYIFNRFVQGKIIKAEPNAPATYLTSWSFYDVALNRPFVCFMYFDADLDVEKERHVIYEVLKSSADRNMPLDTMAYGIDRRLHEVYPKLIKRIDLGPVCHIFTKDEHVLTHAILESISKKSLTPDSFAVDFSLSLVKSKGTFMEGGFFSKQTMQRWGTTEEQKYLFAPHRVIQMLYTKVPEIISDLMKPPFEVSPLNYQP